MEPRAPFRYWGSKVRMAPWIIERLPPHDHFIEGCAGSAAVLFAKPPTMAETVNDLYGEVVNFFRVLRDPEAAADLIDRVALTPYSFDEFALAGTMIDRPEGEIEAVERAWAFFVRMQMAVVPGRSGWSFGVRPESARKANKPGRWATMPELLQACAARFDRVQVDSRPVVEILERYDAPGVLIFVDPPYTAAARPKSSAPAASPYREDAFDHSEFLAAVAAVRHAAVAIVHYPDALYDAAGLAVLGDYESHRNVPNGEGRTKATERLYLGGAPSAAKARPEALF